MNDNEERVYPQPVTQSPTQWQWVCTFYPPAKSKKTPQVFSHPDRTILAGLVCQELDRLISEGYESYTTFQCLWPTP